MSDSVDLTLNVKANTEQARQALRDLSQSEDALTAATGRTKEAAKALAQAQDAAAEAIGLTTVAGNKGAAAAQEYAAALQAAADAGIKGENAAAIMAESIGLATAADEKGASAAAAYAEEIRSTAAAMAARAEANRALTTEETAFVTQAAATRKAAAAAVAEAETLTANAFKAALAEETAAINAQIAVERERQATFMQGVTAGRVGIPGVGAVNPFVANPAVLGAVGGAVALGAAVKEASDLESALHNLQARADLSAEAIGKVREQALALATDPLVARGPTELVQGLTEVYNSGLSGSRALDVWKAAAIGATATGAKLEDTAHLVALVMQSQVTGVDSAAHAMDMLTRVMTTTRTDATQLGTAMADILPLAQRTGVSFQEVSGALIAMGQAGESATRSKMALIQVLKLMVDPTTRQKNAIGEYANELVGANRQSRNLGEFIARLNEVLGDNAQRWMEVFPGLGRSAAAMALVEENGRHLKDGIDQVNQSLDGMGDSAKKAAIQMDTLGGAWDQLLARMKASIADKGTPIEQWLKRILQDANKGFDKIGQAEKIEGAARSEYDSKYGSFGLNKPSFNDYLAKNRGRIAAEMQRREYADAVAERSGEPGGGYPDTRGPTPKLPPVGSSGDAEITDAAKKHIEATEKLTKEARDRAFAAEAAAAKSRKDFEAASHHELEKATEDHLARIAAIHKQLDAIPADQAKGRAKEQAEAHAAVLEEDRAFAAEKLKIHSELQAKLDVLGVRNQRSTEAEARKKQAAMNQLRHYLEGAKKAEEDIAQIGAQARARTAEPETPEGRRDASVAKAQEEREVALRRIMAEAKRAGVGLDDPGVVKAMQSLQAEMDNKISEARKRYSEEHARQLQEELDLEQRYTKELEDIQAKQSSEHLKELHEEQRAQEELNRLLQRNADEQERIDMERIKSSTPQQAIPQLQGKYFDLNAQIADRKLQLQGEMPAYDRAQLEAEVLRLQKEQDAVVKDIAEQQAKINEASKKGIEFQDALLKLQSEQDKKAEDQVKREAKVIAELQARLKEVQTGTKADTRAAQMKDEAAQRMGFTGMDDPSMPAAIRQQVDATVNAIVKELDAQKNRITSFFSDLGKDAGKQFSDAGKRSIDTFFDSLLSGSKKHKNIGKEIAQDFEQAFVHSLGNATKLGINTLIRKLTGMMQGGGGGGIGSILPSDQMSSGNPADASFIGPKMPGAGSGIPGITGILGGIAPNIDKVTSGFADLAKSAPDLAGGFTSILGSLGGGGGAFGSISSIISMIPIPAFDSPTNDSAARRSGSDYASMFKQGMHTALATEGARSGGSSHSTVNAEVHHHYHGGAPTKVDLNRSHEDLWATVRRAQRTR